ncbi:hypothetical protein QC761_0112770 [Podospora bellae-mahoneyi]|uniref:Uncharacterized protein n=1 Tax=Podospora bellae-mahoneyi TaxID=2093777 RepID=A0ABR0F996_9PEZI|nr:hypothetical protein QC761_0112770 [Podospora bellae-mahoneyi]
MSTLSISCLADINLDIQRCLILRLEQVLSATHIHSHDLCLKCSAHMKSCFVNQYKTQARNCLLHFHKLHKLYDRSIPLFDAG